MNFSSILLKKYQEEPDKRIIFLQHSGQSDLPITYRELIERSASYVNEYEMYGIKPGEVVILILEHGIDLINAYFGTIMQGAIPSIMPFLTEKLQPDRYRSDLASLVSITQPTAIVTYADFYGEVETAIGKESTVRKIIVTDQVTPVSGIRDKSFFQGLARKSDDIVLLQHSSGTTGLQKGVALSHQAVINQLESYSNKLHISNKDVIVSWLPLYHDMGLIAGFLMPILLGIPLVIMSPFDWVRAPYRLMQSVSQYQGTISWLPNFAYNFCAQKIRDRHLEGIDLSSWRAVINCSEPMRLESHEVFYERFKDYGLRKEALCTCYAMAENVFAVTQGGIESPVMIDTIDQNGLQSEWVARPASNGSIPVVHMVSAGLPIDNAKVRIYSDKGDILPERCIGEIALKSNCLLTEYYHRPDETSKAFRDGWYLTGDYGYLANGEVYITGRKKDLIIVGGKNIYPQDIERLVMEVDGVHPGRTVAFGVYDDITGTEDVVVVAEVDIADEFAKNMIADEIRKSVTRGSAIALRYVHLVGKHWLIKTSSGKTARSANREKYLKEIGQS